MAPIAIMTTATPRAGFIVPCPPGGRSLEAARFIARALPEINLVYRVPVRGELLLTRSGGKVIGPAPDVAAVRPGYFCTPIVTKVLLVG